MKGEKTFFFFFSSNLMFFKSSKSNGRSCGKNNVYVCVCVSGVFKSVVGC